MPSTRVESPSRRTTWHGMNDGLSQAVEMAVTPVLFTLLGLFIDRRLDTVPLFAVGLLLVAVVGNFIKAYYVYKHQCEEEASRRWAKPSP